MAEGTYEYECMRAELLGIEKPDYEAFLKSKENDEMANFIQDEDLEVENLKDSEQKTEDLQYVSGRLNELNGILQVTQKKINRLKNSCGSLTNLLRGKIGFSAENPNQIKSNNETEIPTTSTHEIQNGDKEKMIPGETETAKKGDLERALDGHVDRLDALIDQAENAQYSMSHQNKQMRRFLN